MSRYYYFYESIQSDTTYPNENWVKVDEGGYIGVPDSIIKYGCTHIKPNCEKCKYQYDFFYENEKTCYECWDMCTTYLVTKEQAEQIQAEMNYNKTLFTDLMDKINKKYIYLRYG